jgi:hypothetical protein
MSTVTIWQVRVSEGAQWCDNCNTSSLISVDAYVVHETDTTPDTYADLITESPTMPASVRHQGHATRCVTCHPFGDTDPA